MGKKIVLIILICNAFIGGAQEVNRDGLLKGTLTISPGFMLDSKSQPFYFHGLIEYYADEKLSVTGEGSFYLGDLNENEIFKYNNSIFAGFNYHPLKNGASDLFIGFPPGISFTMLAEQNKVQRMGINPIASLNTGYNYFINEYFHFFLLGKTILGKHSNYRIQSLSEFRFSAGLGFSIPTKQK